MTFGTLNAWPSAGTGSLLDGVKPDLHSDLTIGNLETALGTLPMSKCSPGEKDCYQFEAPDYTARDLKHDGFAAVNVANNHTLDAGSAGEASTDAALRAAHLKWTGRPWPDHVPHQERHQDRAARLRAVVVRRGRARHPGGRGTGPPGQGSTPRSSS